MRGVRESGSGATEAGLGVVRIVETTLPTRHGTFRLIGYREPDGLEHVAMVMGLRDDHLRTPAGLACLHFECLTGDVLGSRRCDCGEQLDAALAQIAAVGEGVVVYVRGHQGRGLGLIEQMRAYARQNEGPDALDADIVRGHLADARDYRQSAQILADLGLRRIRLLTANPEEAIALRALGIDVVERTSMFPRQRSASGSYRATQRARRGRDRPDRDAWAALLEGQAPGLAAEGAERELVERYGDLACCGPRAVIAQLGQSLDGFIASRTGDADFVTGEADRVHLHRLRALVDAVIVGVGTVIADDCRLTVRAVAGEHPVRVVLDPNGRVPVSAHVLSDGVAPTLWLVGERARTGGVVPASTHLGARVDIATVPVGPGGRVEPGDVLALLGDRGLGRVLVEGGGRTVSAFFEAGVLDRLYLTTAPVLIGDGVPGLRFDGSDRLADALRAPARRFLLGEDTCTELLLR